MNSQEFDPRTLDPNTELTDEQRLVLAQQEEDKRLQEEGDANEAAGLNRDGTPKEVPPTPPVAPVQPAVTPASQGPVAKETPANVELGAGMRDAPSSNTSTSSEANIVKQKLAKQPKLPIFLPLEAGERKGMAYRSVTINSYRFEVKKGMIVYVPQAVHDLLVNAMQATADATEVDENLENADGSKRRALGLE